METNHEAFDQEMNAHEMNAPLEALRARLRMLQSGAVEAEAGARAELRMAEARLASALHLESAHS
jgi:hypothetical protein